MNLVGYEYTVISYDMIRYDGLQHPTLEQPTTFNENGNQPSNSYLLLE